MDSRERAAGTRAIATTTNTPPPIEPGRPTLQQADGASWRLPEVPRVLVVTPSLDQAAFLPAAIESVLDQDYPRLEYFVADGGSTDGSVEILRRYGERLRWVSSPDAGQAAAIADAWAASDADVVAWLNSDDLYLPGAVRRAVDHLRRYPDAGMVYGQAWFVDDAGARLDPYPTRPFDAGALRNECFICQPATFVRRAVFERVGLPDRELRYCMDYDLWIRLSRHFSLRYLEEYLACSRLHRKTKSHRELSAVFAEIVRVTERSYGVAPRNWYVAHLIHRAKQRVEERFGWLPAGLRRRLVARQVVRDEAGYRGPLHSDAWAGTATLVDVVPDRSGRVSLRAESPYWPHRRPLEVAVELDGRELHRQLVRERGEFLLEFALPAVAGLATVLLRASGTFVPCVVGLAPWDERPLSFMVR